MKIINSLLLLFGIFVFVQSAIPNEYLYLRQMGPTDCLSHKCSIPSWYRQFSLHVFQNRNDTYIPTFCDNDYPFAIGEIESLVPEMFLEWPDFWNWDEPQAFWAQIWAKHGTCALPIFKNEYNFFEAGLVLKTAMDVEKMMIDTAIVPSNTTSYTYDRFDDAIISQTLKKPAIHCVKWGDKTALHSFNFCYDLNLNLIDCSDSVREQEAAACTNKDEMYFIQLRQ
ncbi:ribonuclease t2 [Anaeramoeba flamelloides]|uniref:Ribonuclease t2 n=1 Tax=Anaeramoeba flamelloides TaxID=1746091 RepID=A0ABQ8X2Y7_9EUKA|nr:ribonuclease t2 [Anaeramoeba flamelloides]